MRVVLVAILMVAAGCRPAEPVREYRLVGQILAVDHQRNRVTIRHQDIDGFMPGMTMPFPVRDVSLLNGRDAGELVEATLSVQGTDAWVSRLTVTGKAPITEAAPLPGLGPGDRIADASLVDQDGAPMRVADLRGHAAVVSFIYTRCPLADYCPRMSRDFADIDHVLAKDPALYKDTHLLSVSFDPKYDTPKVLRSYGGAYTGRYTEETFKHWDFAAPSEKELPKVLHFFLVGVTPGPKTTLTHSLSTVVITPDGKIYKWYPTNDWKPEQLVSDVKQLLKDKTNS